MNVEKFLAFVGGSSKDKEKAAAALEQAEQMVDGYTRGRHIQSHDPLIYKAGIEGVIRSVAARLYANPFGINVREQVGAYSLTLGAGFQGFTLAELAILNRYRVTTR